MRSSTTKSTSNNYLNYRHNIKNGDLLIWDTGTVGALGAIYGWLIQIFTRSQYIHVAIALVENDRVMFVEAARPEVQISMLSTAGSFYHIPMNIEWKDSYTTILKSRLGEKYSILEAIRSYLFKPKKDRQWQCAELLNWFYKTIGIKADFGFTPKSVIQAAMEHTGNGMYFVGG